MLELLGEIDNYSYIANGILKQRKAQITFSYCKTLLICLLQVQDS